VPKNGEKWGLWEKMGFGILGKKWKKNEENGVKWMVSGGFTAAR
jgi:hypothetical protein